MTEQVGPGAQCATCRSIGPDARCNACPKTPWQEYATSEDGVREYDTTGCTHCWHESGSKKLCYPPIHVMICCFCNSEGWLYADRVIPKGHGNYGPANLEYDPKKTVFQFDRNAILAVVTAREKTRN